MGGIANTISYWGSMVHKTGLDSDLELIVKWAYWCLSRETCWALAGLGAGTTAGRERQQREAVGRAGRRQQGRSPGQAVRTPPGAWFPRGKPGTKPRSTNGLSGWRGLRIPSNGTQSRMSSSSSGMSP